MQLWLSLYITSVTISTSQQASNSAAYSTAVQAAEALAGISGLGEFALAVAVTVIALAMMGPMCDMFGGALFNPVHNAAFVCAGKGSITLNIIRMVSSNSRMF